MTRLRLRRILSSEGVVGAFCFARLQLTYSFLQTLQHLILFFLCRRAAEGFNQTINITGQRAPSIFA